MATPSTEQLAVTSAGLSLDAYAQGPADGIPVVALHGFPQNATSWDRVAPALVARGARVIAPDQRGYSPGARPDDVSAYAVEHLVGDVLALLDELGLASAHVVGHDWGAAVAWALAAHHPDRVTTLTAVSVPHLAAYGWALTHDPDQQERASYIQLFRRPGKAEELLLEHDARRLRAMFGDAVEPELVDRYVRPMQEPGALTAALNWYRAMGAELGQLPAVRVPTTHVWSNADWALGRAGAERTADHVDAPYAFVELDGVSHWIPEEAPDALADAIIARVAELGA